MSQRITGPEDLKVYKRSRKLARLILAVTKNFPKCETFSLTDQVRRSSRSVGAQIVEAWAKRRYPKHFVAKLTDADAELHETRHWIAVARECDYISREEATGIKALAAEVGSHASRHDREG